MTPTSRPPRIRSTLLVLLSCLLLALSLFQALSFIKPAGTVHDLLTSATPPSSAHSLIPESVSLQALLSLLESEPDADINPSHKRLIYYNRPPKTGSTTVRIAMKRAVVNASLISAKCFNRIEWNELALRTIINRRHVDFYGCHTRFTAARYATLLSLRAGNVTFMTSTRHPAGIILSAYLQEHFRFVYNLSEYERTTNIHTELWRYRRFVHLYPVDALYGYHGGEVPLKNCPTTEKHEADMRQIAARFEIVVDLARPDESASMVHLVTGLPPPDFGLRQNVRINVTSASSTSSSSSMSPMMRALAAVDVSYRSCGNEMVHRVLTQQFNIIKDRLLRNYCFDEYTGNGSLCDRMLLDVQQVVERSESQSHALHNLLHHTDANMSVSAQQIDEVLLSPDNYNGGSLDVPLNSTHGDLIGNNSVNTEISDGKDANLKNR